MVSNGTRAYKSQQSEWTIPWWQARPISGWANVRDVKGRYLSIPYPPFEFREDMFENQQLVAKRAKPHCQCDSFYTCLHNEISCFLGQMGKRMVFWFFFCTKTADSISAQMREREMAAMTWPRRVRQKFQTCFPPWKVHKSCIKFSNHTKSKLLLKIRSSSQTCQTLESVTTKTRKV